MLIWNPNQTSLLHILHPETSGSTRLDFNETHTVFTSVTISQRKQNITQIILNILKIGKLHHRQFHKAYITRQIQVTHDRHD